MANWVGTTCGSLSALCRFGIDTGSAVLTHWFLFVLFAVLVLAMSGRFGRGVGVHNIFNDDKQLRLYEADREKYSRVYLNSPSLWASAGAVLYLVFAWSFAYLLMNDGPLMVYTEGSGTFGPAITRFAVTVGLQSALSSLIVLAAGTIWRGEALQRLDPVAQRRLQRGVLMGLVWGGLSLVVAALLAWMLRDLGMIGAPVMLLGVAAVAAVYVWFALSYRKLIASLSLISVLALLALGYALLSAMPDWGQPLAVVGLGVAVVAYNGGRALFGQRATGLKMRFPGLVDDQGACAYADGKQRDLKAFYDEQDDLRKAVAEADRLGQPSPRKSLTPYETLDRWLALARVAQDTDRPKMVMVTTSGGAYRAAFWTAIVLDRLANCERNAENGVQLKGFSQAVRLITGASGGMIGGAYFAATASDQCGPNTGTLARIETDILSVQNEASYADSAKPKYTYATKLPIPRDSLSAVAQQLVQRDLPGLMSGKLQSEDRGTVLEDQWDTLNLSFENLKRGETEGWRPSLILSPMLAETGQPLLIGNLDLFKVLEDRMRGGDPTNRYSKRDEVVQLFDLFPQSRASFKLKTAVRMNAAFPYIAPDTALPTRPYRRVVDAGYYDNYGVNLASAVLDDPEIRDWLVKYCDGVVVIQIRAFRPPQSDEPDPGPLAHAFQWLTTPLESVLNARSATQLFRNRQTLHQVIKGFPDKFAKTVVFELDTDTSLNWYLPQHELDEMILQFSPDWRNQNLSKLGQELAAQNEYYLDQLKSFWHTPLAARTRQVGLAQDAEGMPTFGGS